MQTNNLKRLVVLYWRHSTLDWENSWTTELYEKLIYDDELRLRYQNKTEFIFANVNRRTESYQQYHDVVDQLRRHKLRYHPLVFMDLWFPNQDFSREEMFVIENKHDVEQIVARIKYWMRQYER